MKLCLVIDDSNTVRMVVRRHLQARGWTVAEAQNGPDALKMCQARMPDAVFLDWHLPVTTTEDFLTALRILPGGRSVHVVYCPTIYDPVAIAKVLGAGADDYLMKPFDEASLVEKFPLPDKAAAA
jgi:two-component system chemotaxis response regulator CheY